MEYTPGQSAQTQPEHLLVNAVVFHSMVHKQRGCHIYHWELQSKRGVPRVLLLGLGLMCAYGCSTKPDMSHPHSQLPLDGVVACPAEWPIFFTRFYALQQMLSPGPA